MKIEMKLLSDTVFGNGNSIPGGEDIAVLCDEFGFPYYKGSTFKGVFREELERNLFWKGSDRTEIQKCINSWLGFSGDDGIDGEKIVFSDFTISDWVRKVVLDEIGTHDPQHVLDAMTNLRTFTAMEEGIIKEGSMRIARCVNQGITLCSEILCTPQQEKIVEEVLGQIKWIGSMRNRGFGKIQLSVVR